MFSVRTSVFRDACMFIRKGLPSWFGDSVNTCVVHVGTCSLWPKLDCWVTLVTLYVILCGGAP